MNLCVYVLDDSLYLSCILCISCVLHRNAYNDCRSAASDGDFLRRCRGAFEEILTQSDQVNSGERNKYHIRSTTLCMYLFTPYTPMSMCVEAVMEDLCLSKSSEDVNQLTTSTNKRNSLPSANERVWTALWQRISTLLLDENNMQEDGHAAVAGAELSVKADERIFSHRKEAVVAPVAMHHRWRPLHAIRRLWSSTSSSSSTYTHNPCAETYLTTYLNRRDVQQALNVIRKGSSLSVSFAACNSQISSLYSINDVQADATKLYSKIVSHRNKPVGLQILVLSGDTDLVSTKYMTL